MSHMFYVTSGISNYNCIGQVNNCYICPSKLNISEYFILLITNLKNTIIIEF
jgi:hypothetical protein